MKNILKRSLNDLFGKNIQFQDWQVTLIYSSIVLMVVMVYVLS